MADYGIKISKATYDVKTAPTETTKKNYTILSTDTTPKVSTQAYLASATNIAHGSGFVPMWDAYRIENSGTEAHPNSSVSADATYLYVGDTTFYIIYLDQP